MVTMWDSLWMGTVSSQYGTVSEGALCHLNIGRSVKVHSVITDIGQSVRGTVSSRYRTGSEGVQCHHRIGQSMRGYGVITI